MSDDPFPAGFTWGAGTSAYQIEGAADADGKGPSVWDEYSRRPGAIRNGDNADVACDHYRRFREDVALMRHIGLPAYRFSVSWPRVLPAGAGGVNEAGLAFYDALVDELLAAGVEPWLTLFHWDFPLALFERGGWLNPDSPRWFSDYVRVVVERVSDRVSHWITINEPQCFLHFGHATGINAPGLKLPLAEQLAAAHNVLLAHGRAVGAIRDSARTPPTIGWAPAGVVKAPATEADVDAARQATQATPPDSLWSNAWFSDPVLLGRYPDDALAAFGDAAPKVAAGDMALISTPIDFLGLNLYFAELVKFDDAGAVVAAPYPAGWPRTTFDWPVSPDTLYWAPKFFAERYDVPLVITENGLANGDWVATDGGVHDPQRIDFLTRYLRRLADAIRDGVDVRGYFHWSLLDNLEWSEGYRQRFGLVHVDFPTGRRTMKDSARWYSEVIRSNGRTLVSRGPG